MKKLAFILFSFVLLTSCKSKEKKAETIDTETTPKTYLLDSETVIVNWIGYKFTEKKGVKGLFKTVKVTNHKIGATIEDALIGASVSIPVSSIFSQNESRDTKLKTLFFGMMDETELLSATITQANKEQGILSLTMNNETHDLPFTLVTDGNTAYLKATINLNTWNADKALASIHKACELLHTGSDGVSKTWNLVDVDATLNFKNQ